MIRRPPRSTPLYSSAASDVYKRQVPDSVEVQVEPALAVVEPDLAALPAQSFQQGQVAGAPDPVSYTHLRAHETKANLVSRLLLEKKTNATKTKLVSPLS